MMQRYRTDLFLILALLLLPLLLFAPVSLGNKTLLPADTLYSFEPYQAAVKIEQPQNPLLADLVLENYVWQRFIVKSVRAGQLPLWDPFLFTGHPFLANGQHSALYPLRLVFHLFPLPRAYGIFIVLQLGLAGISSYLLGRTMHATRLGAFLAGITFQFSGFLVVSVVHPMIVAAAAWLPLQLTLVELTIRRRPFRHAERAMLPWAVCGALSIGLQMLAGHAEITYFSLLVVGTFAAWRLLHGVITLPREQWRREVLSPALGLLLMVVLGLALGAVQFIPLYEIVHASFRQDAVTLQEVLGWAYPKRRILTFLTPNFFGNPTHRTLRDIFKGELLRATTNAHGEPLSAFDWGIKNYVEGGAYLGLLPLLLAFVAIFKPASEGARKRESAGAKRRGGLWRLRAWFLQPYVPYFTGLALFSLGCIFGTPLYAIVYALPLINQSHSPFRWVFPLTVAVSALAALGATTVSRYRRTHGPEGGILVVRPRSRYLRLVFWGTAPNLVSLLAVTAIWGGGLLLGGLWASRLFFAQLEPLVEKVFWSMAKAAYAFPDPRAFYSYEFHWLQQSALLLIITGIALRVSRCPIYLPHTDRRRPIWELLAVVVLVVDLLTFGIGFNPQVDPALLDYTPEVVQFLRQDQGLWRFSTFDPHGQKLFNANAGMYFDFQDVRGYDSLFTAQYARYMGWIEPQGELPYNRIAPFTQFSSLDSPLTDLLNVKYIFTDVEIPLPRYREVYQDESGRVYENLGVMPRAFTLPQSATLAVPDVEAVGEAVLEYDPRHYVLVEESPHGWSDGAPVRFSAAPQAAEPQAQPVVAYEGNQVVIEATVDENSWLVLGDAYFPGWKVFVRPQGTGEDAENESSIARVAGNFRGVQLEPGDWTIRFKYSPDSVKFGAFISFLAGMILFFLGVLWFWRRTYRETEKQTAIQRIAKNSLAPILLTLFNRAVDFAFAALMLRILGPANAGDYYYAITLYTWFDIITNFGLDAYLMREVARHREQGARYLFNVTALRLILSVVGLPLLAGFIALRQNFFAAPVSMQALTALGLLYLGLIPGSISKGLTSLFYAYEKAEYPAAISTISTLLKVILGTVALFWGWGIVGLAGASILVNLVTVSSLGILTARLLFRPAWQPEQSLCREMLGESWPLMINHLLATLFFKIDIFLLEALRSSAIVGLYSTGYKFLDALNVIPAMFTLAIFPVLSRQAREEPAKLLRFYQLSVKLLLGLALPVTVLTTLVAREMVYLLGGAEYLPGSMFALQLMVWSMPIGWINSLTQYVLIALDRQRYLTRAYLLGFAFSLGTNLIFIPRYGYRASAIIHIFAELVLCIPFLVGLQQQVAALKWKEIIGKPLVALGGMLLVATPLFVIGRWWAFIGALCAYPLVVWRINLLAPEERKMLSTLFHR
ncbi:MAG: flippase [Chloroflexota bacterium]|nr:flippase [Chloroflexota bacterium]